MLRKLNFPSKWIGWIKECITTASANVLVNGSPSGEFPLERGIRQGDPLSPFLFLVAAEGLNILAKKAIKEGLLKGAVIGREKVEVPLLQYADDTIFLLKGTEENVFAVKCLLKNFEVMSGLSVNFEKSFIYGVHLERDMLARAADVLGCRVGDLPIPYLGMKIGGRVNGVAGWSEALDRMKHRLSRWDPKTISIGGRVTLVKSVLTSLPLYLLSFLHLPKKVEKQFRSLQRNFLWGGNNMERKVAWVKWEDVCKDRKDGGLGVKDLLIFNKALLSKWLWRFLTDDNSLWIKVIKSRFGELQWSRGGERKLSGNRARTGWWKMIVAGVTGRDGQWFWDGMEEVLGDGSRANFWDGFWSGEKPLKD